MKLNNYRRAHIDPEFLKFVEVGDISAIPEHAYVAFRARWSRAKRDGIGFELTLAEWWAWWQSYDDEHRCVRWTRRGLGKDRGMCMARIDTTLPYTIGNIRCIKSVEAALIALEERTQRPKRVRPAIAAE